MNVKVIVLGVVVFHCLLFLPASGECPAYGDPNNAADDPNILDNGLFECGDPNLTTYGFIPPIRWERIPHPSSTNECDCYAGLHPSFASTETTWEITHPFQGNSFVLLSTGDLDGDAEPDLASGGSILSQTIFLYAGDTITGAYFFGTTDYRPYNDYASIYLELAAEDPNDYPNAPAYFSIPGTQCNVEAVGDYKSTLRLSPKTDGWIPFSYTVEPNQAAPYFLRCEVADDRDTIYESYYAVDNLRICRGGQSIADLNWDCDVDLSDYSIISEAWLAFCPDIPITDPNFPGDPNDFPTPADPNTSCQMADLDNSWFVDPNDLIILSDQWLIKTPARQ